MLSVFRQKFREAKQLSEEGFTVLELIIVVVIIGILASIAIPLFANQSRNGIEATLKSDMRNAAMVIMTEASKNQGRMPQWLPNYATKSPDNIVSVVANRSNQYVFCLQGQNPNTTTVYYYSSATGQLSETACPSVANGGVGGNPITGGGTPAPGTPSTSLSWTEKKEIEAPTRKALYLPIVHVDHSAARSNAVRLQILSQGYYSEVRQVTHSEFLAMSDAEFNSYHTVITYHNAWSTPQEVSDRLTAFYNQGGKVMQDGNDNEAGKNPLIDTFHLSTYSSRLDYSPTKNTGLSPAFPYTFSEGSYYAGDAGWRCITGLKGGGVPVAETNVGGSTCAIVYAGTNSNGGRWVAHSRFINLDSGVGQASIDWLNT